MATQWHSRRLNRHAYATMWQCLVIADVRKDQHVMVCVACMQIGEPGAPSRGIEAWQTCMQTNLPRLPGGRTRT